MLRTIVPVSTPLAVDLAIACARLTRLAARLHGEPHGVGRALATLDQFGPMSVGAFAMVDNTSQPTVTKLFQRLEAEGVVERRPDPDDRRSSLIGLTDAGRERLDTLRQNMAAGLDPALDGLDDDQLQTLRRAAVIIRDLADELSPLDRPQAGGTAVR